MHRLSGRGGSTARRLTWPGVLLAALAVVFALGALAVRFAPAGSHVAAWWPAAGFSVAVALRLSSGRRTAFVVGIAVVSAAANAVAGRPLSVSVAFGLANASEVVVASWLLTRHHRPARLATLDDLTRLLVAAVLGAASVAVLAAATVELLGGGSFLVTVKAVLASHAAAVLVIAPLGMQLVPAGTRRRALERVAQWSLSLGVLALAFAGTQRLPLVFLCFLPLLWSALRFSTREVSIQLIVIGVGASLASAEGWGPLAQAATGGDHPPEVVGSLVQTFLASTALMAYVLSVVTAQWRTALAEVSAARRNLTAVLAAATGTGIIGTDLEGTITVFNPGAENILGYSADQVVGVARPDVFHDPGEIVARAQELGIEPGLGVLVHHLHDRQATERRDWTYVRPDGELRMVSLTVSAVRGARGDVTGYLGIAHDVTERRRGEQLLRDALEKETEVAEALREAAAIKSDFVSSVSHELRTPMTSVLGYAEVLAAGDAGDLSTHQLALLERIRSGGTRMLSLVENLLTLSRIEAGTWTLSSADFDLSGPVEGAVEVARMDARSQGVELVVDGAADGLVVTGDAVEVERMLANLLSNAVKFTPAGRAVTLRVTGREGCVRLTVADEGIGIPESEQPLLFDRFFRASNAQAGAVPGTGLGLSIVQAIVERHRGAIRVESEVGVGTTFTVELPVTASEGEPVGLGAASVAS